MGESFAKRLSKSDAITAAASAQDQENSSRACRDGIILRPLT
jgi:hypothetical protein